MNNESIMAKKKNMKKEMMGEHSIMKNNAMSGMMMKHMMDKSMIATTDGGVIILIGKKLMKFDKDLNLIKEVEIKVDTKSMPMNMMEMMKDCPMMQGKMMEYK